MSKHTLSGCLLVLLVLLAACNLNMAPDNTNLPITGAPVVQMVSPLPNATYLEGVPVNIQVLVTNAGADIAQVDISVDDTVFASVTEPNTAGAPSFSVAESWPADEAGTHTISVTAARADGTTSEAASVTISVVSQVSQPQGQATPQATDTDNGDNGTADPAGGEDEDDDSQTQAQPTARPTNPPEPTDPPEPTNSPTPNVPMATFTTGVNVRRGPDTVFDPPIGSYAANDSAEVLAVSPDRAWYKVRYYNSEGWVFANLMTVSGNIDNLPVDEGPPRPTLTPTPVPATPTPQINVNLVAGNITTNPSERVCGETFRVSVDIANFGESRSPGGRVRIEDIARDQVVESTEGAFGEIEPGQTINVGPIPITVVGFFEEQHTLRVIVDPGNSIPETNEDDNRNQITYTLRKGDC